MGVWTMDQSRHRWTPKMEAPFFKLSHWRKSSQWCAPHELAEHIQSTHVKVHQWRESKLWCASLCNIPEAMCIACQAGLLSSWSTVKLVYCQAGLQSSWSTGPCAHPHRPCMGSTLCLY